VDERTGRRIAAKGPAEGEVADLCGARGVQIGDHNVQTNIFGGTVTVTTPRAESWPVRVGPVPLLAGAKAGEPARAAAALEQLLGDVQRVLGPDHPLARSARDNLATVRGTATRPDGR
jgi:hypothetical protein